MRIQELEQKTGLERPTIRYYEREGLVIPKRTENGYREYSEEDAVQLLKIKLLRQLGMSVDQIRKLQQGSADFRQVMESQITQLSIQIQAQKRNRIICQTLRSDGFSYQSMDNGQWAFDWSGFRAEICRIWKPFTVPGGCIQDQPSKVSLMFELNIL